jgi:predicted PurR-regulated permease PerM
MVNQTMVARDEREREFMNRLAVASLVTIALILVGILLLVGRSFFLPVVTAATIAFVIISIAEWFAHLQLGNYAFPRWLSIIAAILFVAMGLNLVVGMIGSNIVSVIDAIPIYQDRLVSKLTGLSATMEAKFGVDIPEQLATLPDRIDFVWMMKYLAGSSAELASSTGLILIYLLFMLLEYGHFEEKVAALFPQGGVRDSAHGLMGQLSHRMKKYVRMKTLLSSLTAVCSYAVLIAVGVDFASFWAFLIFLLNFIPNIGSIIATVFPCLLAFVQFDTWTPVLIVIIGLIAIQIAVGNILEPRLMSRSFNLSGLVIILALVTWGSLWGLIGMFLSVPLTVMASIILGHFKETRWIAVMLSEDGRIGKT